MLSLEQLSQAHAEFPPSAFFRFLLCNASWLMSKLSPQKPETEASKEGTMLHTRVVSGKTDSLTLEQQGLVEDCQNFMNSLKESHPNCKIFQEERVYIMNDEMEILTFGTVDFVLITNDGKAIIVDWKFGRDEVEAAERNWQIFIYAIGIQNKYGVKEVEGYVFQPRVSQKPSSVIVSDFNSIAYIIEKTINACKNTSSLTFTPGIKQCKHCPGKGYCNAFDVFSRNSVENTVLLSAELVKNISDQELDAVYQKCKSIKNYNDKILEAEIRKRIEKNGSCHELAFKPGGTKRNITDFVHFYKDFTKTFNENAILECCNLKLGDFQERLAKFILENSTEEMLVKNAKIRATKMLEKYVKTSKNRPSIQIAS